MKAIDRIYQYIEFKGINNSKFEKICGISNGYIGKMYTRNADIGETIMLQVLENCPDINIEWLILGNGPMLKTESKKNPPDGNLLLQRFEELVAENALLKKELEDLKKQLGRE